MSYVVHVWAQPGGEALPEQAQAIWSALPGWGRAPCGHEPRFLQFAQGMLKLYPELAKDNDDEDFWIDDLQHRPQTCVWPLGLYCGERQGLVRTHLIKQALKLGLNVADMQSGELFLSDGRIYQHNRLVASGQAASRSAGLAARPSRVPPASPSRAAAEERLRVKSATLAEEPVEEHVGFHAGHLALLLAVSSPMLMLALVELLPRSLALPIFASFCLSGAWGVWRCSADLQWGLLRRAFGATLALIPFVSLLPSTYLLISVLRARRD